MLMYIPSANIGVHSANRKTGNVLPGTATFQWGHATDVEEINMTHSLSYIIYKLL